MTTYREPSKSTSRRSIGNLDGTSFGTPGVDTARIQPGTGNFLTPSGTVVENTYVQGRIGAVDINMQNVGSGAGVYARKERDGLTFNFRRLQAGSGISIQELNDSIVFTASGEGGRFINLSDTPKSFVGMNGKTFVVDEASNSLVFADLPTIVPGIDNFLDLTDTPDSYEGSTGKYLRVSELGTIRFDDLVIPDPVTSFLALTDTPDSFIGAIGKVLTVGANYSVVFSDLVIPEQGARITFAEFPPSNPRQGDGWWNTVDGSFFLYYVDADSGQWIESGASEPSSSPAVVAPYDYGSFYDGQPQANETIYRWRAPRAHTLSSNFAGCLFTCGTNPTNNFSCKVWINGAQVGTWTINPAGAATLVSSVNGRIDVPANVEIKIVAPAQTDATLADLVVSFKGERS